MIGPRTEITGTLEVLSPLTIGSGRRELLATSGGEASLATIVRAKDGRPYIPGASIKGVLRRLNPDAESLFGPANVTENDPGFSGLAIFWDAYALNGDEVGTETRTSVDEDTGTAAAGRLFTEEYVKPGAEFEFELFLSEDRLTDERDETGTLKELLGRMMADGGFSLGSDTRQGKGRVRLKPDSLEVHDWAPGIGRTRLEWHIKPRSASKPGTVYHLRLSCDGPFLILDNKNSNKRTEKADPHLVALHDFDGNGPRLTGATLVGALRAAYNWHMAGMNDSEETEWFSERAPTSVDRLFGTTQWRGVVEIDDFERYGAPTRQNIASVKIDRFSGAPMDNALFVTEGWIDVAFDLTIRLAARDGLSEEDQAVLASDARQFATFLECLKDETWGGLELGHGANRGYGWFRVEDKASERARDG